MSMFEWLALALCSCAAIADQRRSEIPNALTYPVIALAPLLHVAGAWYAGSRASFALMQGGCSLLGMVSCGAVPYVLWRKRALGGGDLKLFGALGALLLPRAAFHVELYVFALGALIVGGQFAYRGRLFATVGDGLQALIPARFRSASAPDRTQVGVSWFRLGPCFVLAVLAHLMMSWTRI